MTSSAARRHEPVVSHTSAHVPFKTNWNATVDHELMEDLPAV